MPEAPQTLIPHWRIDGTLTTLGPLRIGDGSVLQARIPCAVKKEAGRREERPLEVMGVSVDSTNHAFIPGSSLKGFLRSYLSGQTADGDRKSTRLNSSHLGISYAVFCLKKK